MRWCGPRCGISCTIDVTSVTLSPLTMPSLKSLKNASFISLPHSFLVGTIIPERFLAGSAKRDQIAAVGDFAASRVGDRIAACHGSRCGCSMRRGGVMADQIEAIDRSAKPAQPAVKTRNSDVY